MPATYRYCFTGWERSNGVSFQCARQVFFVFFVMILQKIEFWKAGSVHYREKFFCAAALDCIVRD